MMIHKSMIYGTAQPSQDLGQTGERNKRGADSAGEDPPGKMGVT